MIGGIMGLAQSRWCCCPTRGTLPAKSLQDSLETKHASHASAGTYQPPHESLVISTSALQRPHSRFADFPFGSSTRQDGYPPPFFKRLDKYIKENGFRARDVFVAIDHDHDRSISVDEMISGFNRIDFTISKKEERMLREWMQQIVGHDLSFKEFTLALKQRASLTSPQRISILKLTQG